MRGTSVSRDTKPINMLPRWYEQTNYASATEQNAKDLLAYDWMEWSMVDLVFGLVRKTQLGLQIFISSAESCPNYA